MLPFKSEQFLLVACVTLIAFAGELRAQDNVWLTPDRLREGDGQSQDITIKANVAPGAQLSISVSYSSDPNAANTVFISKFSVQDNSNEDKDSQAGKIEFVLPRRFDKTGLYLVEVDKHPFVIKLVHEPNNSSYIRQFVDWLVKAAGSGQRGEEHKSARARIEDVTKKNKQETVAIWTAPLPAVGTEIAAESLRLAIPSALMPAWSRTGNYLACSAWRNGKWVITAYTINRRGAALQSWQWNSRVPGTIDFSPAWSPRGDAIAFVRVSQDQKSDVWILRLDRNRRPIKEVKVTDTGNVQAVLGWDKDVGLLFETQKQIAGSIVQQLWGATPNIGGTTLTQPVALSDSYKLIRGSAPIRKTVIYAQENKSPPYSELCEVDSNHTRTTLLPGDFCSRKWPTASPDEKWLAFDYGGCPR